MDDFAPSEGLGSSDSLFGPVAQVKSSELCNGDRFSQPPMHVVTTAACRMSDVLQDFLTTTCVHEEQSRDTLSDLTLVA